MTLPLGPNFALNLVSAICIFAAAGVPIYLAAKVTGNIRRLTVIFATFIMVHGFYHISVILGFVFLGEGMLEPLSVLTLIAFGAYYLRLSRRVRLVRSSIKD
ncbi:MAG TPA: hypothetical protein VFF30_04590 [Nitrososphaerales archaeon]|nr:hypothetical protein [Nitrososphaerales archaeon]